MSASIQERMRVALNELSEISAVLNDDQWVQAAEQIIQAKRVVFSAQGRSGFCARCLVCRLMHIGIDAHMAGQPDTPAIGPGDLLVAISSSAKTQITCNHLNTAKKVGAHSVLITASEESGLPADYILCIPARSKVATVQHAGSLFEQSVLLAGDALCWFIQQKMGTTEEIMNRRHANLQ